MKYLLDTDHITILQIRSGREYATLSSRMSQQAPSDVVLSIVSFHEQVLGGHSLIARARRTEDVVQRYRILEDILYSFWTAPVLPFDSAAATVVDSLRAQRFRLGTMDLRIASIALSRNLVLLTRNIRDFGKVPGLVTEDWTT